MRNFLIMPNVKKDVGFKVTKRVISFLQTKNANVYIDNSIDSSKKLKAPFIDPYDESVLIECIIVIGGDGSVLDASACAIKRDIPILCVNMGRLGYLSELGADSLEKLNALFENKFKISSRMTLDVTLYLRGEKIFLDRKAVNDVVISRGETLGISDFELNDGVGNCFSYRADGVILSTPTGSTAYSLSAGGPAIDSSLEAICVTPICTHSFFNRSILFSPNSDISVTHVSENDNNIFVNIDGIQTYSLSFGDIVSVTKSKVPLKLISLENTGILGVLHKKMKI